MIYTSFGIFCFLDSEPSFPDSYGLETLPPPPIPDSLVALYTNRDKTLPTSKPLTTIYEEKQRSNKRIKFCLRSFQFTEGSYHYPDKSKVDRRRRLIKKHGLQRVQLKRSSNLDDRLEEILAKLDEACLSD